MTTQIRSFLAKPFVPFILIIILSAIVISANAWSFLRLTLYPLWGFLILFWIVQSLQNYYKNYQNLLKWVYSGILPLYLTSTILIGALSFQIDDFLLSRYGYPLLFIGIVLLSLFIWDKFLPAQKSFYSFHILVQILWLSITAVMYYFWWPANLAFTVLLLPTWLFLGVAWFWTFVLKRRWWSLAGVAASFPLLLLLSIIGTSRLNSWATERQLDRFITSASEGELIDNIKLKSYGGIKIADFLADSTPDYEIMYLDTLIFGPDEYRVDFCGGVTYHVSIQGPYEDGQWYIGLDTWRYD